MSIQRFDRMQVRAVSAAFYETLQELADALGLQLQQGGTRYSSDEMALNFTLRVADDGSGTSPEQRDWELYAPSLGLKAEWYGRDILVRSRPAKIVAIKPRNRKYPVIVQTQNGRRYKYPARLVGEELEREDVQKGGQ